jgi:D-alanyl-D-alanine dipeptidase
VYPTAIISQNMTMKILFATVGIHMNYYISSNLSSNLNSSAKNIAIQIFLIITPILMACCSPKEDFVYLHDIEPSIIQEIRYAGEDNFIGKPILGYNDPKCILTKSAARSLAAVQAELKQYAMGLRVYDCYRPQRAVDSFVLWAKDLNDNKMKSEFYPHVDKTNLFRDGYIAAKSGHSRGSTVDLTINNLDFGTTFDYFDPLAHTANPEITKLQKQNRLLLKLIMEKNGFKNLPEEWWHYTLKNEPFQNQYFDFEIN